MPESTHVHVIRSERQITAFCPRCKHHQLFVEEQIDHRSYLGLSLVTLGLGLVSWLAACIGRRFYPWKCEHCGWQKPRSEMGIGCSADPEPVTSTGFGPAMELKHRAERHRQESAKHE